MAGQVRIGDRKHAPIDEVRCVCGSAGIAACNGDYGLAELVEKPSKGLSQASCAGNSDRDFSDTLHFDLTLALQRRLPAPQ